MAVTIKKEQIRNNAVDAAKLDSSDNFSFSGQIRYTGSDTNTQALATRGYVETEFCVSLSQIAKRTVFIFVMLVHGRARQTWLLVAMLLVRQCLLSKVQPMVTKDLYVRQTKVLT
mgnify:CR=1 FL=1